MLLNVTACKSNCKSSGRPGTQRGFRFGAPEQLLSACHRESVKAPPSPWEGGGMVEIDGQVDR